MKYYIFPLLLLLINLSVSGQSHSFYTSLDTIEIDSKVFNAKRKISVSIPLDYKKIKEPKNAIIYLDGDNEEIAGTMLQTANNLYLYDDIPQSILIGVFHEDRNKELTEKEKLYRFIKDEVYPFLNEKYSIRKELTIVGHSFGGYFSTYCFLKNNALFSSCVAISPAYWPNDKDIYELAEKTVATQSLKGNLYVAIGDKRWDDVSLREGVFAFNKIIERNKSNLRFQFQDLVGFNHNTTPTVGFGLGLNFCFDQWEWASVVEEQDMRIASFPDFWRHYELKADALHHLGKIGESISIYRIAIEKIDLDKEMTKKQKQASKKRLQKIIRSVKQAM